jgi:bacterioferritin
MGTRGREIVGSRREEIVNLLEPKQWYDRTNCGYEAPDDPFVETVIDQNIKGEQCAIDVYQKLAGETKECDPVTYETVLEILRDEIEHEEDLQGLAEDLDHMKTRFKQWIEETG